MFDSKKLNELVQSVIDFLPEGLKNIPHDFEKNLRAALSRAFERMDLVTRDEFETQSGVLKKTRQKLEQLEKRLDELEQKK